MSDEFNHPNPRIDPPLSGDEEALREFGRQLAMDSLIEQALSDLQSENRPGNVVALPPRRWWQKAWIPAAAAALVAVAGLALWKPGTPTSSPQATLDPRWELIAAIGADYRILNPNHVELRKGELRFTSLQPASLVVDTPHATATAQGTDFLIGHHLAQNASISPKQTNNHQTNTRKIDPMKQPSHITRLLVLAGSVILATDQGSLAASPNEAIVAQAGETPQKLLVDANSSFAFDMYAQLAKENQGKNLFFSPYSMSNALLMVAEGARGQTAREMGTVLGFPEALRRSGEDGQSIPWEMAKLRLGQSELNRLIQTGDANAPEQTKLRVANAVWANHGTPLVEDWKTTVNGAYGAGAVQLADFRGQPEAERIRINDWTADQTEGIIKDLFPKKSITPLTSIVLVNAIYFKGDWQVAFNKSGSSQEKFTLGSGQSIETALMVNKSHPAARYAAFHGDGSFFATPKMVSRDGSFFATPEMASRDDQAKALYPDKDGFAMIEMPYKCDKISMVVIAPNDPAGLPSLEARLNPANLAQWIKSLEQRETHVYLPKFKMEASYPELKGTLAAMGMPTAFEGADFSGLCSMELDITTVVHKAFIDVNEEGTEAAAATGIVMGSKSAPISDPFIPTFRADRPFIYLIRDQKSGAILFLGRILNPSDL